MLAWISGLERIGGASIVLGTVLFLVAAAWFLAAGVRALLRRGASQRLRAPGVLLGVGILLVSTPILINSLVTRHVSLGPLEQRVDGELFITLTGWDQSDYSVLRQKPETVGLQMANPDVTDATLEHIVGMKNLRELDLNNSQITDAGLKTLTQLSNLEELRLSRTQITDQGLRDTILKMPSVKKLELLGTTVKSKTVREWKDAGDDRAAVQ